MRNRWKRSLVLSGVGALVLAGCGSDAPDDQAAPEEVETDASGDDSATDDGEASDGAPEDAFEPADPNDDVEDGVYRGQGVVLPVPDGWSLDPMAAAQGMAAAVSDDGSQQLTAQAIDADLAEAAGQPVDLETLLDNVRQIGEPDVDEEVELAGAERAHQLTFLDLPAQEEGGPTSSATIVIAEDGAGRVGQFIAGGSGDDFDNDLVSLLLETAGFDPDSEPPAPPEPAPAPEGGEPEGGEPEESTDGEESTEDDG